MGKQATSLVTGATGNVGSEVVKHLLKAGAPVKGLVHDARRISSLPQGVEPVVGDLNDPQTFQTALTGLDNLFLLPGYHNADLLLQMAHEAGVKRILLLSSAAADLADSNVITAFMAASEKAVRHSGITWTIIRPQAFMTNSLEWATQLKTGDTVRAPFPNVRLGMIDPSDIGMVAAEILIHPSTHTEKTYALSGPESLRPVDRVQILGEVLKRKLVYKPLSDTEGRTEMLKTTPPEYVEAFMRFYADGLLDESAVLPSVKNITGIGPGSFREWAIGHTDSFNKIG